MTRFPLAVAIGGLAAAGFFLVGYSRGAATSVSGPAAEPDRSRATAAIANASHAAETQVEIENVDLHADPELILHIHYLYGQLIPTRQGQPPTFDDKLTYLVAVDSAEIGVSAASMTHALNTYVFNRHDSPMRNVTLTTQGGQIKQSGTLNKGPGIPFEMVGTMSATADGKIRIHPTQLKAAHLPVKGLMKLLGLDMAKLINTSKTNGLSVDGDDIVMDATQMLPPPLMRGKTTAVSIQGDQIIQTIGQARKSAAPTFSGNYMYYRGGELRFGKLTMNDTDMRLIDMDPGNSFDFFPDHYQQQLIAGYSKNTKAGGLLVYMPDYNKIEATSPARRP